MIPNFWSLLLPFEFILYKNWNKPHFFSNDYLFCHKWSHLDKILSFLYALAKNQIWNSKNALSVQELKRKGILATWKLATIFHARKLLVQGKWVDQFFWFFFKIRIQSKSFSQFLFLSDCNGARTHNHLVLKQTLNHLAKLAKWLSCIVSTYLYGAFDCMFLSCHVCVSEWIHTL